MASSSVTAGRNIIVIEPRVKISKRRLQDVRLEVEFKEVFRALRMIRA
tara:strand:- start:6636 stop:6779 length:144 start_codon:yes stop_codon:yes gene_type:complete